MLLVIATVQKGTRETLGGKMEHLLAHAKRCCVMSRMPTMFPAQVVPVHLDFTDQSISLVVMQWALARSIAQRDIASRTARAMLSTIVEIWIMWLDLVPIASVRGATLQTAQTLHKERSDGTIHCASRRHNVLRWTQIYATLVMMELMVPLVGVPTTNVTSQNVFQPSATLLTRIRSLGLHVDVSMDTWVTSHGRVLKHPELVQHLLHVIFRMLRELVRYVTVMLAMMVLLHGLGQNHRDLVHQVNAALRTATDYRGTGVPVWMDGMAM
jgi:hypothetical protein